MQIAALILGILGFLISFTFFTDLSIILSILGVVLGIIALKKSFDGKAMCIIAIILSIIGLISCFSDNDSPSTTYESTTRSTEILTAGLNQEVTITNSYGQYSLTITGIREMSERNQFSDKNYPQVFLIDYTYKNISSSDSVYISDSNFTIIDETGQIGDSYPNSITYYPDNATIGTTCKAQAVLGVSNRSNSIKLQYFDNIFNSQPDVIFEIPIQ